MTPKRDDFGYPELMELFNAAAGAERIDPVAQEEALAAFRAVRDDGALFDRASDVRAVDDWRAAAPRREGGFLRGPSLKVLLASVLAAAGLGGVAVAAGTGLIPSPFEHDGGTRPAVRTTSEPAGPAGEPQKQHGRSAAPPGPEHSFDPLQRRSAGAEDASTVAHCKVYLSAVERKGTAPRGTAMARLEEKAGGAARVLAYCATLTGAGDTPGSAQRERAGSAGPESGGTGKPAPASAGERDHSPPDKGKGRGN
jgi:hypothetical protein